MILSNVPGSFAWEVFQRRHPALIEQVRGAFPYPPARDEALVRLAGESVSGVIRPLPRHAHEAGTWLEWGRDYLGQRWIDVPFLWAESYFYRRALEAVGYFAAGPWAGIDPFAPVKAAELDDPGLDGELAVVDRVLALPTSERAEALLHAALWGNRADLGFRILATATPTPAVADAASGLVADDRPLLWSLLGDRPLQQTCLVGDNAGRELLSDLVLTDHLLTEQHAQTVSLHLKPHPYYVSDATTADLIACLRRLITYPERVGEVGVRWQAMRTGRLTVYPHSFYCAPLTYHHMPSELADQFTAASLTIMKGDLNYRRLVGDRHWPATLPFPAVTSYFPALVVALRTLKSEVVVGVAQPTLDLLNATGHTWRTNGTHALIQVRT
ncbi:MAG: damage-control phosphatase ARMT1 family protein [Pseudonocardiaceae bacterium]